jgi:hypothetical protein
LPDNDQILAVSIEARINKLEKEMRKASAIVGKNFDGMEKRSKDAANKIENSFAGMAARIGSLGKNMAAGFVGGLVAGGIAGVAERLGDIVHGIAKVGDEAKRAGLGVEAFQELKFVAEQNRIGVDSLVDGIKELNLRADEFVTTGSGSAASAFQRLGYGADTLKAKLKDPSALFDEIIGKLGQLDRAAAIRIADEIFGGNGGEKFVQLIEQGEGGIRRTKQEARDLGLVMSSDLIDAADDLDRKFNAIANTIGTRLKSAIVDVVSAMDRFRAQYTALDQQSTDSLDLRLKEIGLEKLKLDNLIASTQTRLDKGDDLFGINRGALEGQIAEARKGIEKYVEQEGAILAELEARRPATSPVDPLAGMRGRSGPGRIAPVVPFYTPGGDKSTSGTSSMRAQRDSTREVIAALEDELRMLGASEVEQRINVELRRAGASATDEQKASIRDLVTAIDTEGTAVEQLQQAMDTAQGLAKDFLGGLLSDVRSGVDGVTALSNAFGRLGDKLLDMALDQLVTAAFGNFGFAGGGEVHAATGGLIRGPGTATSDSIPARLSDGEFVVNAAATRRNLDLLHAVNRGEIAAFAAGGLAGASSPFLAANDNRRPPSITINAPVTVNASGGTAAQNTDLADRMARSLADTVRALASKEIANALRPGGTLNRRSQ